MPSVLRCAVCTLAIAASAGSALAADVFLTPADNLADEVQNAQPGDVLVLAPGLYLTPTINVSGSGPLTVRSSGGPDTTTIRLEQDDAPGFLFEVAGNAPFTLEGVTLRGNALDGFSGDTLVWASTPAPVTINNVEFRGPGVGLVAENSGRVFVTDSIFDGLTGDGQQGTAARVGFESTLFVRDSQFIFNGPGAPGGTGASVTVERSTLLVRDCLFQANTSDDEGGAIFADQRSSVRVTGSTFLSNTTSNNGGAIAVRDSNIRILNSHFEDNSASQVGALLIETFPAPSFIDRTVAIEGNTFINNSGDSLAQVSVRASGAVFNNNLVVSTHEESSSDQTEFENNGSSDQSGAILTHNTFVGAGLFDPFANTGPAVTGDVGRFTNNIVRGFDDNGLDIGSFDNTIIDFNNVEGLSSGSEFGPNNIDADPMFVDPASNDFRLMPASPSINAGSPALIGPDALDRNGNLDTLEPTPFDAVGTARSAGAPDHGAFEFIASEPQPCSIADVAAPFGLTDLADVDAFILSFLAGCP